DNHEVAMPILNRFGIPATFYVTVDCIENRPPWPSRLRYVFRKTNVETWEESDRRWLFVDPADREAAFTVACCFCARLSAAERMEFVTRIERELETSVPVESGSLMLSCDHLRSLVRHGHTVGSHTMTHPNIAHVTESDAIWEFSESKRRLEAMVKLQVKHF